MAGGALVLLIAGLSFAAFAKPDGEAVREELRGEIARFYTMPRHEPALQCARLTEKIIAKCRDLPKPEAQLLLESALAKMKGAPGEWKLQAALFGAR